MSLMAHWGFHISLDCRACDIDSIKSKENIESFTKTLVERIDMIAYGEPQVVHFGTGNKAGYTLIQLIQTSNIAGHFCNDTGDAYLDVFSCKPFDNDIVVATAEEFFKPENVTMRFFERQA